MAIITDVHWSETKIILAVRVNVVFWNGPMNMESTKSKRLIYWRNSLSTQQYWNRCLPLFFEKRQISSIRLIMIGFGVKSNSYAGKLIYLLENDSLFAVYFLRMSPCEYLPWILSSNWVPREFDWIWGNILYVEISYTECRRQHCTLWNKKRNKLLQELSFWQVDKSVFTDAFMLRVSQK